MKKHLLPVCFALLAISACQRIPSPNDLNGLWYDENQRESLFFSGDSVYVNEFGFFKYKVLSANVAKIKNTSYDYDQDWQYQFQGDSLFVYAPVSQVEKNGRGTPTKYVKIPHSSIMEYELDKMGLSIDFVELDEPPPPRLSFARGGIPEIHFYTGVSTKGGKVLVHNGKQYGLDTLGKVRFDDIQSLVDGFPFSIHLHLYLDKRLTFAEYSKIRKLSFRLFSSVPPVKFHIKRTTPDYPDGLVLYGHFRERMKVFPEEYDLFPNMPPALFGEDFRQEVLNEGYIINDISFDRDNRVFLNDKEVALDTLHFVLESGDKQVFNYKPHPRSLIGNYLLARHAVKKIKETIWEKEARNRYNKPFGELSSEEKRRIQWGTGILEILGE